MVDNLTPAIAKGLYLHKKSNKFYFVIGVATSCDNNIPTPQYVVVYKGQHNTLYYRKYSEFIESVVIDGVSVPRFEKV